MLKTEENNRTKEDDIFTNQTHPTATPKPFLMFIRYYDFNKHQGLYSLSGRTSYYKISRNFEAARFGFKLFQLLWNFKCLSNSRAIRSLKHPISRLRDSTRSHGKTSTHLMNRGPWQVLQLCLAINKWTFIVNLGNRFDTEQMTKHCLN